jgi:hypothetical protein
LRFLKAADLSIATHCLNGCLRLHPSRLFEFGRDSHLRKMNFSRPGPWTHIKCLCPSRWRTIAEISIQIWIWMRLSAN